MCGLGQAEGTKPFRDQSPDRWQTAFSARNWRFAPGIKPSMPSFGLWHLICSERNCPFPGARGSAMLPIRVILHPSDFSPESEAGFALACALARDQGSRLLVVHAL